MGCSRLTIRSVWAAVSTKGGDSLSRIEGDEDWYSAGTVALIRTPLLVCLWKGVFWSLTCQKLTNLLFPVWELYRFVTRAVIITIEIE